MARADDDKISISAQMGKSVYAVNWLASACSLCASFLSFIHCRRVSGSGEEKRKPNIRKFGSESSSYKYDTVKLGTELCVTSTTHSRNASMERLQSRKSTDNLTAERRGRVQERQYDPYLSPSNPNLRSMSASQSRSPSR